MRKWQAEKFYDEFVAMLHKMTIIPVIGAGFSCGARTDHGVVPSGTDYKKHMVQQLNACSKISNTDKKELGQRSFRDICEYYEADDLIAPDIRKKYLRKNFMGAKLDPTDVRMCLFDIDWPYIYTLNIDDVIENSSDYILPVVPGHEVNDDVFKENKCVIKLHGHIKDILAYRDAVKVFTAREYTDSIVENGPLLCKLKNDLSYQNIVYIGCSLEEEIDIYAISSMNYLLNDKDSERRTIFFTKGDVGTLAEIKLKGFGVTDIVSFPKHEDIYHFIAKAGEEMGNIQIRELDDYNRCSIKHLGKEDIESNKTLFFWGKGLIDPKGKQIEYPYYFIHRKEEGKILENSTRVGLQIVEGRAFSGKSYLMAGLYEKTAIQNKYFFDGRKRLSDRAIDEMIAEKDAFSLIDTGVLSRRQIEKVINNAADIHCNNSCVVIFVDSADGDIEGLLDKKSSLGYIEKKDYECVRLSNRFSSRKEEIDEFNKRMPVLQLLPYTPNSDKGNRENMTFLDHHVMNERELGETGRFSDKHLDPEMDSKTLACLICFAIKEKIYTSDIEVFSFKTVVDQTLENYPTFFEKEETLRYEKEKNDLSSIKYVLNSKYWLRRELGIFARDSRNHGMIQAAFRHLITSVSEISRDDINRRWRLCRPYILYDVMKEVFINVDGGNILLVVSIYEALYSQLAEDYHFLHQNAKCLMNYSYSLKGREKEEAINKGINLAKISKKMMEPLLEKSQSTNIEISYAHVLYTLAALMSERCRIGGYKKSEDILEALSIVYEATENPYNREYKQQMTSRSFSKSILKYIKEIAMLDIDIFSKAENAAKRDKLVTKIFS